MKLKKLFLMLAGLLVLAAPLQAAEEGYPLRKKFPALQYISTNDLSSQYDKALIVDVRSKLSLTQSI